MERKFEYLWNRQVVYRRDPITDIPNEKTEQYMFFKDGTYQAYDLFKSKAKITTYRSFYWHMMVLWYLNPEWEDDDVMEIAMYLANRSNGFITFHMNKWNVARVINDLSVIDRDEPPRNKIRKIIFKMGCGLTKSEKLSIVGTLIGRLKRVHPDDVYQCMIDMNDMGKKITIRRLAGLLDCSARTIHRNMCNELKREKELLNREI